MQAQESEADGDDGAGSPKHNGVAIGDGDGDGDSEQGSVESNWGVRDITGTHAMAEGTETRQLGSRGTGCSPRARTSLKTPLNSFATLRVASSDAEDSIVTLSERSRHSGVTVTAAQAEGLRTA